MAETKILNREEWVEQAYLFRTWRERLADNIPTQEVLAQVHQEILSTTRLPLAILFLASEIKYTGLLGPAMERIGHYFTPFQAFIMSKAEEDRVRFTIELALLVLEREAQYKAEGGSMAGLFIYQFETISRNRLGYDAGLVRMAADPMYDEFWRDWIGKVRGQIGVLDFAEVVYYRSELAYAEQRRRDPDFSPSAPPLFGEKEGKIAKANRGKDPLYLFAALQRQLGYPQVPRPARPDESVNRLTLLERKVRDLEAQIRILTDDVKGDLDLSKYVVKPDTPPAPPGAGR